MRGPYPLNINSDKDFFKILQDIGCDDAGAKYMLEKANIFPLFINDVKCPAANILKQQMLSLGGEAAVARWTINCAKETTDVVLLGTLKHYRALAEKIIYQPWGLKALSKDIIQVIDNLGRKEKIVWQWGNNKLIIGERTLVMGILNVTPDSFSDGGKYTCLEKAIKQAEEMVENGADIIDIGGESTRPGAATVSIDEEINRVMPVLEVLLKEFDVPISVDTYKSAMADESLKLGAHIINDVGGGRLDSKMPLVVKKYERPVIVMHNPGKSDYDHIISDCVDQLKASVQQYEDAGVLPQNIMIDPGIGFGKKTMDNLTVIKNIQSFFRIGKPILLGASRKSFIGSVLGDDVSDRLEGSLAVAAWAVNKEIDIVRVHDVKETVRMVKMFEAIKNDGVSE